MPRQTAHTHTDATPHTPPSHPRVPPADPFALAAIIPTRQAIRHL